MYFHPQFPVPGHLVLLLLDLWQGSLRVEKCSSHGCQSAEEARGNNGRKHKFFQELKFTASNEASDLTVLTTLSTISSIMNPSMS